MARQTFLPAYLRIPFEKVAEKAKRAGELLKNCVLCPRKCGVDRTKGEVGFCKTGDRPSVSSWGPHFGEERPLVGRRGSGTLFFTNCNLGCLFCQNYTISHLEDGHEISVEKLAEILLSLQKGGCHNINLVTPTHQIPMILQALLTAIGRGLTVPIVYNCGGYESLETIELLDGVVDIYMPDFKFAHAEKGREYSRAIGYPAAVKAALREMHRQVGDLVLNEEGVAQQGLLVRHLVLPGGIAGTGEVVKFLADEISKNTYLNIMDQYHPCYQAFDYPPLDRRITRREFSEAVRLAMDAGLTRLDGIRTS